jgi:hypothetical protein
MNKPKITIVLSVLVGCVLVGCATDTWAAVDPGAYVVVSGWGEANKAAMRAIQKMEIDRDKRIAVFTLDDGSEIVASFVPRARAEWPTGCPTNVASTHMEVLDIEGDSLTIAQVTFSNPILVRACLSDPVRVLLRQDGEIGGGGGACNWPLECIFFGPQSVRRWTVSDSTVFTDRDSPVTIKLGDDIDPETFNVTSGPKQGSVVNNYDLTITYTPNGSLSGIDVFEYRICNMDGYCDTATVTLTVKAVDRQ